MQELKVKAAIHADRVSNEISDLHNVFLEGPVDQIEWCKFARNTLMRTIEELKECLGDVGIAEHKIGMKRRA